MQKNLRPLWTEGMFLGPQHFQQHDRFLLDTVSQLAQAVSAYLYGVVELEIDTSALVEGKFAIKQASGLFPDGTPFNLPETAALPEPVIVDSTCKDAVVSLAIPFENQQDKDAAETRTKGSFSRYILKDSNVRDRHSLDSEAEETVFTGELWTRLSLNDNDHTAFHTIPLARISEKREDDRVIIDSMFYPCSMNIKASAALSSQMNDLQSLVTKRIQDLSANLGRVTASDTSQLDQLLLLQILNRFKPLLKHINTAHSIHPEMLYRELMKFAAEMCTITHSNKQAPEYPEYLHRDQYRCFEPLLDNLRLSLNWIPDKTTEAIPVQHVKAGIYTASIKNRDLFETSRFILAAKAKTSPDEISQRLPRQTTISSKSRLRDLVEAQSRGIGIKPVINIPNSIPMYENYVYFDMHTDDALWQEVSQSGDVALHIAGSYTDLKMQIWATLK